MLTSVAARGLIEGMAMDEFLYACSVEHRLTGVLESSIDVGPILDIKIGCRHNPPGKT